MGQSHVVTGAGYIQGRLLDQNHPVQTIRDAQPKGFYLDWSKQPKDSANWSLSRNFARRGISFTYTDLGTPILGKGYILTYFLEPVYRIGKKFQFQLRADVGLGYYSNPYNIITNPLNRKYSLPITPTFHFSAGFGWKMTKQLTLVANSKLSHMSNGNFKEPNAGINWRSFSAGLLFYPGNNEFPKYGRPGKYKMNSSRPGFELGLLFVPKQGYHEAWKTTRKYTLGGFTQVSKQTSRINGLTAGAELIFNNFTDAPGTHENNSKPSVLASVNFGHEFLFSKLVLSTQAGRYITRYPAFYEKDWYHRWGLRYKLNNRLAAGINLKVHGFDADFVDFRIQYKIF